MSEKISREKATVLIEPRCDAIYDALGAFHEDPCTLLDLAADAIACIRVAVGIRLAIHVRPSPDASFPEELVGRLCILLNDAMAREVQAIRETPR